MISPTTQTKRNQVLTFIERKLEAVSCVRGVVGIGSIAISNMRPNSDIDAILFMDPVDLYVAPAEAILIPAEDSFHSIFSEDAAIHERGAQLDLLPWLPDDFETRGLVALNAPALDFAGYAARFEMLNTLLDELLARLIADGDYSQDPISEAFIRAHEEPGRAWNMVEWEERHRDC